MKTETDQKIAEYLNTDYIPEPSTEDSVDSFPIISLPSQETSLAVANTSANNEVIDADVEFTREALRQLVQGGTGELPKIFQIASQENSPRAYEVGTNMLKTIAEIAEKLVGIHKTRKEIDKIAIAANGGMPSASHPQVSIDKAIVFSGTTAEYLDKLGNAEDDSELLQNSNSVDSSVVQTIDSRTTNN